MCILYNQRDATYIMFFIIINALHVSGGPSAHHQEPINCMCSPGYCHAFLLSTAGVDGLELFKLYKLHLVGYIKYTYTLLSYVQLHVDYRLRTYLMQARPSARGYSHATVYTTDTLETNLLILP